jgi:nicotinamidase-related amidase
MKKALLVIDMQVGLFHGPQAPFEGERVLANINTLIVAARAAGAPVVVVRHTGPEGSPIAAGSALWQVLPELGVDVHQDHFVDKTRPSCFFNTGLAEWLDDAGVGELVICGMKTDYCIDSTGRLAGDLGFKAVLVADAHTTMDSPVLDAAAIIAHHNQVLAGPFVKLLSTAEVSFQG